MIWTYLNGTRLGDKIGEGDSVTTAFSTPGLKTVELRLTEFCVGTSRLVCDSITTVTVDVGDVPAVVDTTAPTFTASGLEAEATGPTTAVDYTVTATDPDDAVVAQSCTPAAGSAFPVGSTPVECSAVDSNGNVGTASFTVVVDDTTPPAVTVPFGLTAEATSAAGAAVNIDASATDLVDGTVGTSCTPSSAEPFPLGATTVTCSATDASGNTGSASFDVDVVDTTAPDLSVPTESVAAATSPLGTTVDFAVTATDSVAGAVAPDCSHASGDWYWPGSTMVTCTATDEAGNVTAPQSFSVEVDGPVAQLTTLVQTVTSWQVKGHMAEIRTKGPLWSLTQVPPKVNLACQLIRNFEADLAANGPVGQTLTDGQRPWLYGEFVRIYGAIGCPPVAA